MLDMVNRSHNDPNGKNSQKSLKWILVDSIIIALIAMCAVIPEGVPSLEEVWLMFKIFLVSLAFQLAVERGLKRKSG